MSKFFFIGHISIGCLFQVNQEMHRFPLIAAGVLAREKLKTTHMSIDRGLNDKNWENIVEGSLFLLFKPDTKILDGLEMFFETKFFCIGNLKRNKLYFVGDKKGDTPFHAVESMMKEKYGDENVWGIDENVFKKSWENIRNGELFLFYIKNELDFFPTYSKSIVVKKIGFNQELDGIYIRRVWKDLKTGQNYMGEVPVGFLEKEDFKSKIFYLGDLQSNRLFVVCEKDGDVPAKAADSILKYHQKRNCGLNVRGNLERTRKRWEDIKCCELFTYGRMRRPCVKIVLYSPSGVVSPLPPKLCRKEGNEKK